MANTPRLGLRRPQGSDAFNISGDLQNIVDILDNAAIDLQGTLAARPAASAVEQGTLYFETDTKTESRSDGTTWFPIMDLAKLGLSDPLNVRRGILEIATEEQVPSTLGYLTTHDEIANIVVPSNGFIDVWFSAIFRNRTNATRQIGGTICLNGVGVAPGNFGSTGNANAPSADADTPIGIKTDIPGFGVYPIAGLSGVAHPWRTELLAAGYYLPTGFCRIRVAAGTYAVGVKFLTDVSSGGTTLYNRHLMVATGAF